MMHCVRSSGPHEINTKKKANHAGTVWRAETLQIFITFYNDFHVKMTNCLQFYLGACQAQTELSQLKKTVTIAM